MIIKDVGNKKRTEDYIKIISKQSSLLSNHLESLLKHVHTNPQEAEGFQDQVEKMKEIQNKNAIVIRELNKVSFAKEKEQEPNNITNPQILKQPVLSMPKVEMFIPKVRVNYNDSDSMANGSGFIQIKKPFTERPCSESKKHSFSDKLHSLFPQANINSDLQNNTQLATPNHSFDNHKDDIIKALKTNIDRADQLKEDLMGILSKYVNQQHTRNDQFAEYKPKNDQFLESAFNKNKKPDSVRSGSKLKKRGNYKITSLSTKQAVIKRAHETSIKQAAREFDLPEKNIKRWIANGPNRKKGAGRKTMDPFMEIKLLDWIKKNTTMNNRIPDSSKIKGKARDMSKISTFKASKGWCDKFYKRNSDFFAELKKCYN